jgi:methylmalonyl-CoA mutase cobalamin-binding subunit
VTLAYNLYQEALAEVQSISSNDTDDTPVAAAYTDATKVLLVSGLDGDTTRTLTVDYYAETDSTVMRVLGPFLAFLIFGFLLLGIVWGIVKGRR